ncbi:MAG: SDR family oxidoreductase [Pirellulaceae bacterium]|nr:SDR family oxidoreductase [Pirellulaceae bacterium]
MPAWTDKTAVVLGGSSGLGLSIARRLILQGAGRLVIVARSSHRLEAAADELRQLSQSGGSGKTIVTTLLADLADARFAATCAQQLAEQTWHIDLLVQSIGLSDRGQLRELSRQRLIELVDANVVTSLHTVQFFAESLKQRQGVLVMVGSLSSLFAPRFLGGYSIAKHGLTALAQQARLELADEKVHVMLCCPGPIARDDAGSRYNSLQHLEGLPEQVRKPGGGAQIRGLDPERLAEDILHDAHRRKLLTIYPHPARWLRWVTMLSQSLGERILKSKTS